MSSCFPCAWVTICYALDTYRKLNFRLEAAPVITPDKLNLFSSNGGLTALGDNINTGSFLPGGSQSVWQSQGQGITAASQPSCGHFFALALLGINSVFSQQHKYWMWQA